MKLKVQKPGNKSTGSLTVSDAVFDCSFNEGLVHQVVTAYLAGARAGTKAQRNRARAQGGGAKPWRQKGTGRARAGTIRSPIWRGGGKAFAAAPRDYSQKVNRKMFSGALRAIISELHRQDRLVVVEEIAVNAPKTRELIDQLRTLELDDVLIVSESPDDNLYLAARNLPRVDVLDVAGIDPVSLVRFSKVLMTKPAIKQLEERLA